MMRRQSSAKTHANECASENDDKCDHAEPIGSFFVNFDREPVVFACDRAKKTFPIETFANPTIISTSSLDAFE
jgi:hypothetical protein